MTEQSERGAFEADARGAGYPLERAAGGDYADVGTRHAWNGWQSRGMWQAARASSPTYAAGWSAGVEAAAKVCEARAVEILAKQSGSQDHNSIAFAVDINLRMCAVMLPDLAIAIRALALPAAATDGDAVERVAINDVAAERKRQIEVEGRSIEGDDLYGTGALWQAGACYLIGPNIGEFMGRPFLDDLWPWEPKHFKPKSRRRDLVRAAALIVAEIERLDRAALARGRGEDTP